MGGISGARKTEKIRKINLDSFFDLEVYMSQIENNALYFSKDLMIRDRNMQFMESDFSGDRGDQLLLKETIDISMRLI